MPRLPSYEETKVAEAGGVIQATNVGGGEYQAAAQVQLGKAMETATVQVSNFVAASRQADDAIEDFTIKTEASKALRLAKEAVDKDPTAAIDGSDREQRIQSGMRNHLEPFIKTLSEKGKRMAEARFARELEDEMPKITVEKMQMKEGFILQTTAGANAEMTSGIYKDPTKAVKLLGNYLEFASKLPYLDPKEKKKLSDVAWRNAGNAQVEAYKNKGNFAGARAVMDGDFATKYTSDERDAILNKIDSAENSSVDRQTKKANSYDLAYKRERERNNEVAASQTYLALNSTIDPEEKEKILAGAEEQVKNDEMKVETYKSLKAGAVATSNDLSKKILNSFYNEVGFGNSVPIGFTQRVLEAPMNPNDKKKAMKFAEDSLGAQKFSPEDMAALRAHRKEFRKITEPTDYASKYETASEKENSFLRAVDMESYVASKITEGMDMPRAVLAAKAKFLGPDSDLPPVPEVSEAFQKDPAKLKEEVQRLLNEANRSAANSPRKAQLLAICRLASKKIIGLQATKELEKKNSEVAKINQKDKAESSRRGED